MKKLFFFLAALIPLMAEAAAVVVSARPVVIARPVTVAPTPTPKVYTPPKVQEAHTAPAPAYIPVVPARRSTSSCDEKKDKDCKK